MGELGCGKAGSQVWRECAKRSGRRVGRSRRPDLDDEQVSGPQVGYAKAVMAETQRLQTFLNTWPGWLSRKVETRVVRDQWVPGWMMVFITETGNGRQVSGEA